MAEGVMAEHPDRGSVGWQEARPCSDCDAVCEPGYFDTAYHECTTGDWNYFTFTIPKSRWERLTLEGRALWPDDRVAEGK